MNIIITRDEWGARPPTRITPLNLPVRMAITHHGVSPATPARTQWQGYQRLHMDVRRWTDLAYNWGIANDGTIYEGRGWDRVGGATGSPWDAQSLSFCWIGNFHDVDRPSDAALESYAWLLAEGVRLGKLTTDFVLSAHRDHSATACCGDLLYPHLPAVRRRAAAITNGEPEGEPMSLTVRNLRTGHEAFRDGEAWAIRFVQQVLSLPALDAYKGQVDGQRSPQLNEAITRAKAILPGATGTGPAMGADLWRELVRVGAAFPAETAIVPADCSAVEAQLAEARGLVATERAKIQAAQGDLESALRKLA